MTAAKCDDCGRFTRRLVDVWATSPTPSIDREVCPACAARIGLP